METTDNVLKCRMCKSEIDSTVMVTMMWLAPNYETLGLRIGTASYELCTSCATKIRDMLEGAESCEEA